MSVIIQSRYDRLEHDGFTFTEPTLAQQHFKDECDVNNIMKKYANTGLLPEVAGSFYDEAPDVTDYQSLQNYLLDAEDKFMSLPSLIRKRFDNDPGLLINFLNDDNNLDEAIQLGLVKAPVKESEAVAPAEPQPLSPDPVGESLEKNGGA